MDILKEKWIAVDGCIYTERTATKKSEATGKVMEQPQRESIAFNVGNKVAAHIVVLHNKAVEHANT